MYEYREIRELHVELTENCNAACPMCGRNRDGFGTNSNLCGAELRLDVFRRLVPSGFLEQLSEIRFCGNFGDPLAARDVLEIASYASESNPTLRLKLNTNGALRPAEWWRELGRVFSKPEDEVVFALDGLADTHARYRQGTSWERVIENAREFIAAGGKAHWAFLVFKHNEHQLDEARTLASEMGFVRFVPKSTKRFFSAARQELKTEHPVRDRRTGQELAPLKPTTLPELTNSSLQAISGLTEKHGSFAGYLKTANVDCRAQRRKSLYLNARGQFLPCCWVASELYADGLRPEETETGRLLAACGGFESIDAVQKSPRAVIEGRFFKTALPESWQPTEGPVYSTCRRICGSEFRSFEGQFL